MIIYSIDNTKKIKNTIIIVNHVINSIELTN